MESDRKKHRPSEKKLARFTKVPNEVLYNVSLGLGASDKLVYLAILEHRNTDGESWPSCLKLGDYLGMSEKTVQRCVARLAKAGVIDVTPRGVKRTNLYRLRTESPKSERAEATNSPNHLGQNVLSSKDKKSYRSRTIEQEPLEVEPVVVCDHQDEGLPDGSHVAAGISDTLTDPATYTHYVAAESGADTIPW